MLEYSTGSHCVDYKDAFDKLCKSLVNEFDILTVPFGAVFLLRFLMFLFLKTEIIKGGRKWHIFSILMGLRFP